MLTPYLSRAVMAFKIALVGSLALCACNGQTSVGERSRAAFSIELRSTDLQPGDPLRMLITPLRPEVIAETDRRDEPLIIQVRYEALEIPSPPAFSSLSPRRQAEVLVELGVQKGVTEPRDALESLDQNGRNDAFTSLLEREDAGWSSLVPDQFAEQRMRSLFDRPDFPIDLIVWYDIRNHRLPFSLPGRYYLRVVPFRGEEGLTSNVEIVECRRQDDLDAKAARGELLDAVRGFFSSGDPNRKIPVEFVKWLANTPDHPLSATYFASVVPGSEETWPYLLPVCLEDLPELRREMQQGPCLLLIAADAYTRSNDYQIYVGELRTLIDSGRMMLSMEDLAKSFLEHLNASQ